jgi:hypothetical protein
VIHHCWLDDFLSLEDAPCDCIHIVIIDVLSSVVMHVHSLVCNHLVSIQVVHQPVNHVWMDEELVVSLLVNIAILRTPSELRVS